MMKISVEDIVQEAEALFTGEYNCAEAVSAAIIRAFRGELPDEYGHAPLRSGPSSSRASASTRASA